MTGQSIQNALKAYGQIDLETSIMTASPVQLIVLLYEGAVAAISKAKGLLEQQQFAAKSEQISKAIGIIEGLTAVLDRDKGGEIAENLAALYDYMKRRLLQANLQNDVAALDEVASLLLGINESWKELSGGGASRQVAQQGDVKSVLGRVSV